MTGGPCAGRAVGQVRRAVRLDDPRGVDRDRAEGLGPDALGRDAPCGQGGPDRAHEAVGAADVVVGVLRDADPVEQREVEPADDVMAVGRRVAVGRAAVGDEPVGVGQRRSSASTSATKACSSRLRAPCSHHNGRSLRSPARACSIARTGVAPTPALIRTTGPAPARSTKSPRGAAVSITSPTLTWSCR